MARTIIRNHYSKQVQATVKANFSGESLGNAVAYLDETTRLANIEWQCDGIALSRFALRLGSVVSVEPPDVYVARIDFTFQGFTPVLFKADGARIAPKVVLRNPDAIVYNGFVIGNGVLSVSLVYPSNTQPADGSVYSMFVECLLQQN